MSTRTVAAHQMAEMKGITNQTEIIDVELFIATNISEWSRFDSAKQENTVLNKSAIVIGAAINNTSFL